MTYYNYALYARAEQIRENTTINLREYAYENTYAALNNYMYKRLDNYIYFYAYREEGNTGNTVLNEVDIEIYQDDFTYINELGGFLCSTS